MTRVWKTYNRELILLALLVISFIGVGINAPSFLEVKSLDAIWHDSALLIVLALGQMLVIMSRGIDLSVAANIALSGMLVALVGKVLPGLPMIAYLLLGAVFGLILGCINAALINALELPPIVSSLGMMSVFRGLAYFFSGGQWVNSNELPVALVEFPNSRFPNFWFMKLEFVGPTGLEWVSIIAVIFFYFLIQHSRFGREIRALGGNPNAAKYVGIPEKRRLFSLYALSGTVAGFVGVLWVARYALASTEIANGFELQVVAACVLGGVSIAGGVGSIYGTVLGAVFLVTLYNALPIINVSPFWQTAIVGVAILIAAVVNQSSSRTKGKHILREVTT
jgi:rhamnose transport system permease protein